MNLFAVPASIVGNEIALRIGRRQWIQIALFGVALDVGGGNTSAGAWAWAYGAIGAGCLGAPLVVRLFGRARQWEHVRC